MGIEELHPPNYSFPKNLVGEIIRKWRNISGTFVPPPLPSESQLQSLLEVAYLSGHETEEGRSLKFWLCCTPISDVVRRRIPNTEVESWVFTEDRDFDIDEIRRIVVSTNIENSAVWIQFPENHSKPLQIHGLLNLGASWANARRAFSYYCHPLPHALMVRVEAPGRLKVYEDQYTIVSLRSGKIEVGGKGPTFDVVGVKSLFEEGYSYVRNQFPSNQQQVQSQRQEFERSAYVNVVFAILNSIQLCGHGGSLIVAGINPNPSLKEHLRIKYEFKSNPDYVRKHFIRFLDLHNQYEDLEDLWNTQNKPDDDEFLLAEYQVWEAERRLAETCSFVGNLSGTDGALVFCTDFSVYGYGAEILLHGKNQIEVYEFNGSYDSSQTKLTVKEVEKYGMRHRSAMRLAAALSGVAVFVVSQDGGVSLVWNHDGKVYFNRGISITNTTMALA